MITIKSKEYVGSGMWLVIMCDTRCGTSEGAVYVEAPEEATDRGLLDALMAQIG